MLIYVDLPECAGPSYQLLDEEGAAVGARVSAGWVALPGGAWSVDVALPTGDFRGTLQIYCGAEETPRAGAALDPSSVGGSWPMPEPEPGEGVTATITVQSDFDSCLIEGVRVQLTTDAAGAAVVWSGVTDAAGVARDGDGALPTLAAGTYYLWRDHDGYSFDDPARIILVEGS